MKKTATATTDATATAEATTTNEKNGQAERRVISDPNQVAQLVMLQIDQVNSKKDELTIAVKTLADTAKQLVGVYGKQQGQIAQLLKRVQELEKNAEVVV